MIILYVDINTLVNNKKLKKLKPKDVKTFYKIYIAYVSRAGAIITNLLALIQYFRRYDGAYKYT